MFHNDQILKCKAQNMPKAITKNKTNLNPIDNQLVDPMKNRWREIRRKKALLLKWKKKI